MQKKKMLRRCTNGCQRVDAKLMPGINSRRVFINQNHDRAKNPRRMYAFSALRLRRMRNKQRDKHYGFAAVEASSVINAHPVYKRTCREGEDESTCACPAKNLCGSAGFASLEKRGGRIRINFNSAIFSIAFESLLSKKGRLGRTIGTRIVAPRPLITHDEHINYSKESTERWRGRFNKRGSYQSCKSSKSS